MRTEGKSELKGAAKALIAIAVVGALLICIGIATTIISDTGITIDDTEITDDSFGGVTFFNYAFTAEKTYAVPELANDQYYILDILKETTVTPTGIRFIATNPFIMASGKSNEDSNGIWACSVIGIYDTEKSVGDSSYIDLLGSANLDSGVNSNTTYASFYAEAEDWVDTTTEGQTYYGYILLYAYCLEAGGCEACTTYFKNFSASTILYQ